jgi:hypothetical protein
VSHLVEATRPNLPLMCRILVFDTEQKRPLLAVKNIHYALINDLTWFVRQSRALLLTFSLLGRPTGGALLLLPRTAIARL